MSEPGLEVWLPRLLLVGVGAIYLYLLFLLVVLLSFGGGIGRAATGGGVFVGGILLAYYTVETFDLRQFW